LVSEIFDLKVADKHANIQNSTSSDNKGRLKLSAREPTEHVTAECKVAKSVLIIPLVTVSFY